MSQLTRLGIVAGLLVVVAAVIALKDKKPTSGEGNSPVAERPGEAATPPKGTSSESATIPRLVDLGADKCVPCKLMAPILEELKKEHAGQLEVVFIDVWKNPDAGEQYGIKMIPTQIFYDATGKERFRHEGFFSKEDILARWKQLGVSLGDRQLEDR